MKYLQTRSFTTNDLEKILVIVLYNQWVVGLSPPPPHHLHTLACSFKEYSENYYVVIRMRLGPIHKLNRTYLAILDALTTIKQ